MHSIASRLVAVPALLVLPLVFAAPASAQNQFFTATLDGLQETPPVVTPATGFGSFVIDTTANTLTFHIEFSGLLAPENNAHIHGFAPPGTPAGILYPLPAGSPKTGVITYLESEEQGILTGQTYVNVHSTMFPAGEIRGQIVPAIGPGEICIGDGSFTPCPCNNNNAGVLGGCLNSIGQAGTLTGGGFASLSLESFALTATGIPTGAAIFFQGDAVISPVVMGNGLRCAGGTLIRLKTTTATNGGTLVYPSGTDAPISVQGFVLQPGTRVYQAWYQDPNPGFCTQSGFNVTNAIVTTWTP